MIKKFFKNIWIRIILILHGIALIGMFLFSYNVSHTSNKTFALASENAPYDVIIVPGYPFTNGEWHDIMKTRVYWSKYLYDNGFTKNIIFSGSAVYTPYIESVIMKSYGEKLNLPSANLFEETQAEHSTENLYYSIKLAKEKGFKSIALATDPVQSYFLMQFASSQNYDIDYLPIQYDLMNKEKLINPQIDPSIAYVSDFVSLPERQGYIERFKGTLGQNVKDLEL